MRLIPCTLVLASALVLAAGQLQTAFEWKFVDFVWPSEAHRAEAIRSGEYNYVNIIPMDVDVDKAGRVFVALLGNNGSPVSVGTVTNLNGTMGPLIKPYPNWSWFKAGDCDSLQNVYRIAIDECNRLWVLDTGRKEGKPMRCPAQLVVFDLNTDTLIQTIKIPDNISKDKKGASLLANPIIDTEGSNCQKTTVYIADTDGNALVMIDYPNAHRIENQIFYDDPKATTFKTGKDKDEYHNGLLGLAVSPRLFPGEQKNLYMRPLTSFDLFSARTSDVERAAYGAELRYNKYPNFFPSQVVVMAFSSQGTMFYGLTREIAIGCWNQYRPLTRENTGITAKDSKRLQYVNGIKVIRPSQAHPDEELWVLSNRLVGVLTGSVKFDGVNYRILKGSVQELIQDTKCDLPAEIKTKLQKNSE